MKILKMLITIAFCTLSVALQKTYDMPQVHLLKTTVHNSRTLSPAHKEYFSIFNHEVDEKNAEDISAEAEEFLQLFMTRLKSFVTANDYYLAGFESEANQLGTEILQMEESVQSIVPHDMLSNQLWFVRSMFDTMIESIESMKYFSTKSGVSSYFVREIIELNIKLYILFDSAGIPDPTINSFTEKVYSFQDKLECILSGYEIVSPKSETVVYFFKKELLEVKKKLSLLSLYLLVSERDYSNDSSILDFPINLPWLLSGKQSLKDFVSFLSLGMT